MNTSLPSTSASDHPAGDHALVIGGSMAGLLAARVLSDRFARVTVVDWDHFPREADHRRRVPQSRHAHGLLERGQAIIARLFPGIGDELAADGALVAGGEAITIVTPAGRLPSFPPADGSAAKGFFASRVLLEWHVRRHMAARDGVRLVEGSRVRGLVAGEDGRGVGGARVESEGGAEEVVAADLVVDASGRQSKAPDWLEELGYERPEEEVIESGIGYASRFYERPEGWPADWEGIIMNGRPPHNPRAGLILPVENRGWHVTLGGFAGHHPPTDEEGFHAWARELPDPSIAEAIRVARPLTPIRAFRTPTNRLRRFDRLRRSPERFVAIGDSVCAFNPIYGQGMTVSAMDAELLEAELARGPRLGGPGVRAALPASAGEARVGPLARGLGGGPALEGARQRRPPGVDHRRYPPVHGPGPAGRATGASRGRRLHGRGQPEHDAARAVLAAGGQSGGARGAPRGPRPGG